MDEYSVEPICAECGQPHLTGGDRPSGATGPPTPRSSLAALAALLLVAVVLAAAWPDGADAPAEEQSAAGSLESPGSADSEPAEVRSLQLGAGLRAAYPSDQGLVIIETQSGEVDLAGGAFGSPEIAYADPYVLVSDDRRTLAVHPAAPDEPFVLASNYRLVATADAGQYVFVPAGDGVAGAREVFVGQASDGSFGSPIALPRGSRRLAVPGVGVLVSVPGGATYEVRFAGLELLSDAEVIAAAGEHRLEVTCASVLDCRTDRIDAEGDALTLAADLVDRLGSPALSPDGSHVAGHGEDALVVADLVGGGSREIAVDGPVLSLAWVGDADVVMAMVGPRDDAALVIVPVEDGEPASVLDLAALDAPAPVGAGLVGF